MMPLKIALVAGVLLVCSASRLLAQSSEVQYQLYEEVYNGSLSIYQSCSATNPQTNEYYSVEAGCGLFNPEGGEVYATMEDIKLSTALTEHIIQRRSPANGRATQTMCFRW
jgi:hypothetical protein